MRAFFGWFFRSRLTGEITIAQAPNLLLWIVIVAGMVRLMRPDEDQVGIIVHLVFECALLCWAVDEIIRGVNPWRRCLGAAVATIRLAMLARPLFI